MDIVAIGRNSGPTAGMDVWLDGSKLGFFPGTTVGMTDVEAGVGPHQLDIYAVGTNGELKLKSSFFTVVPCAFPASGVHICSPANESVPLTVLDSQLNLGLPRSLGDWVASPFTITAAGRNINGSRSRTSTATLPRTVFEERVRHEA